MAWQLSNAEWLAIQLDIQFDGIIRDLKTLPAEIQKKSIEVMFEKLKAINSSTSQ